MMKSFHYQNNELFVDKVAVRAIAEAVGSPCYIYAKGAIEAAYQSFQAALARPCDLICYAVKANGNLAILATLARLGAGFDIVSQGELERVVAAGGDPARVVFSGVGKTDQELREGLIRGIKCFNVESVGELVRLNQIADSLGQIAPVSLRVNPDVDAKTHPYIATGLRDNKFGIPMEMAAALYLDRSRFPSVQFIGLDCHIGSQLTDLRPFGDALDRILPIVAHLRAAGVGIQHIDVGGGLGVCYRDERPPSPAAYVALIRERLAAHDLEEIAVILEPGRALVAASGVLLAQVIGLKENGDKRFAVIDAGMNDLIRPALYGAWQEIVPVRQPTAAGIEYDVVGPVCESADVLGRSRRLAVQTGDLVVIRDAGAYGFSMSSQYNARPRAAEVLVEGAHFDIIRERETFADLMRGERSVKPLSPHAFDKTGPTRVRFTKMHGLGNDFVVFDGVRQSIVLTAPQVRRIADRRFGVGCDQILLVEASTEIGVDFRYRIFNADGEEVGQCGNGARCFARFVRDQGLSDKEVIVVRTQQALLTLRLLPNDDILVDMGSVRLEPSTVPFQATEAHIVYSLTVADRSVAVTVLSLGNPHAVQVVTDIAQAPVLTEGPLIERHPRFPVGVNAGYMQVIDRQHVHVRVFERGAGETLACGSGACAAVVAGRLRGLLDDEVEVTLRGGRLTVTWDGIGSVFMRGPASRVYEGWIDGDGWVSETPE